MADNHREIQPLREAEEPTIRFTIDPALLSPAEPAEKKKLEDTYVGAPLLPPEEPGLPSKKGSASRWVKIACACAAAVAALWAVALLIPRGASAQETAETFLTAMDTGDFALLSSVAEGEGLALTPQNTAPLFALYQSDEAFRSRLHTKIPALARETGAEDELFTFVDRSHFLRRDYVILISPGKAVIDSNLPGVEITLGGAAAAWDASSETAVVAGLLPGIYPVSGHYAAPFGDEFHAETTLRLTQPEVRCSLHFEYTSMDVYNSAAEPVRIEVGGSRYATLEPARELTISPIAPQTTVVAVSPAEKTLSATAAEGYLYVFFDLCQVEIYNDYDVPMRLTRKGQPDMEIPAHEKITLADVPAGEALTASLDPAFGLMPYIYEAEYDYDYLYPAFRLNDAQFDALRLAAETYVLTAYDAYGQGAEALAQLPPSVLTLALAEQLAQPEPPVLRPGGIAASEYRALTAQPDGSICLSAQVAVDFLPEEQTEPAPETPPLLWELPMCLQDGQWTIFPTVLPESE